MVLRALYVATQAAVDLAMHLGADAGFLERDLAERLAAWAGFRNVLAHFYVSVDYERAYDALSETPDSALRPKVEVWGPRNTRTLSTSYRSMSAPRGST